MFGATRGGSPPVSAGPLLASLPAGWGALFGSFEQGIQASQGRGDQYVNYQAGLSALLNVRSFLVPSSSRISGSLEAVEQALDNALLSLWDATKKNMDQLQANDWLMIAAGFWMVGQITYLIDVDFPQRPRAMEIAYERTVMLFKSVATFLSNEKREDFRGNKAELFEQDCLFAGVLTRMEIFLEGQGSPLEEDQNQAIANLFARMRIAAMICEGEMQIENLKGPCLELFGMTLCPETMQGLNLSPSETYRRDAQRFGFREEGEGDLSRRNPRPNVFTKVCCSRPTVH